MTALGVAAWIFLGSSGFAAEPAARAVGELTHDLGTVIVGTEAGHEFVIRNEGGATLTLGEVRSARELRVIRYDRAIPPGETGRVKVAVNTWAGVGPGRLWVKLATNDPARPQLTLDLGVTLRALVVADPGYARYIFVHGSDAGTVAQTLAAADGADFRVTGAEAPPYLRVSYRRATAPEWKPGIGGPQWRLEATITPDAPVGAIAGFILVHLDHPVQKALRIPLSGFVRPMFAVTPPAAAVGDVDPAEPPRKTSLVIKNFARETAELKDAKADVPGIGVEIMPVEPGRIYRLRLVFAPDAPGGVFAGTIRVRTSSPKQPTIEIPLSGRIVSRSAPAAPANAPRKRP